MVCRPPRHHRQDAETYQQHEVEGNPRHPLPGPYVKETIPYEPYKQQHGLKHELPWRVTDLDMPRRPVRAAPRKNAPREHGNIEPGVRHLAALCVQEAPPAYPPAPMSGTACCHTGLPSFLTQCTPSTRRASARLPHQELQL